MPAETTVPSRPADGRPPRGGEGDARGAYRPLPSRSKTRRLPSRGSLRKVLLAMRRPSSTAIERGGGQSVAPRLALLLLSLAAFFAVSFRPVPLSTISPAGTLSACDADNDAPVAIEEEGRTQCRIAAVRPPRDGRGQGLRVRDLPFFAIDSSRPPMAARLVAEAPAAPSGSRDLAPMRRVRRHVEVMVFLS